MWLLNYPKDFDDMQLQQIFENFKKQFSSAERLPV